ncbi:acyl-CoA carboxylase subunit epsilon [Streptomyces sp. NPDC087440]|uniref:acyl-CoA carboxylase subunit epsilon n=1 Tax=Streptomyces sp. NPDC087440 TaxID=3365790 RepID=UPI0038234EAD
MTDHTVRTKATATGITVLRGRPDAAELAAVTAVLTARLRQAEAAGARAAAPAAPARADWAVENLGHRTEVPWSTT